MKIKTVLVSQPKPETEKSPYYDLSEKHNLKVDFHKFIKIDGIKGRDFRKDRINILDHTAVIFTSRNSVDHFFRMCKEMRVSVPDTMKYFCISESTAFYLQNYIQFRKRKIFHGSQNFENLMVLIKKHKEENYLLPCSEIHKQEIPKILEDNDIKFSKAIIYRTACSDLSDLDMGKYHMLVFFSPSGVASLFKNFPEYKQEKTIIAAFGPATNKAVKEAGLKLTIEAPTPKAPSMSMAIDQYLEKNNKAVKKKAAARKKKTASGE